MTNSNILKNHNSKTSQRVTSGRLTTINQNAAGIDIGSREHYVCVPKDRDLDNVRTFKTFTGDLKAMTNWLKQCGIKTVAMESTGVYWIPAFQLLETQGFEVILVNARHVKNVPGRKTDVQDCQWIQQLHSYGLLNGSFRPKDQICRLRTFVRQRDRLIKCASVHINRMQKSLNEMNIQLHHVISDITGVTGMSIIKAIIAGERNANKLAEFRRPNIKSDITTITKALEGNYRSEHLLVLKQELDAYEFYLKQVDECDRTIEDCYKELDILDAQNEVHGKVVNKKCNGKNAPKFNLCQSLII